MSRIDPPPFAVWLLQHLTPADRDDALAGDLLEAYRAGRSDSWYWRQSLTAIVVAWSTYLADRSTLLVFAVLWSMLAPAWAILIQNFQNQSRFFGVLIRMDWPFSTLSIFGAWFLLNMAFLWAGMFVYFASVSRWMKSFPARRVLRACGLAIPLFVPLYILTFILANLLAFPGPVVDRRTLTPLGEIADLRAWAMVLRIPYLLTLIGALWTLAPRSLKAVREPFSAASDAIAFPSAAAVRARLDPFTLKRFFVFVVGAGLLNALIAGFLLCRLPDAHHPTWTSVAVRGAIYVLLGGAAGIMGAWVYWHNPASPYRDHPPVPFLLFALTCASGWVWVPAVVLLYEQVSPASALIAMLGAFVLAAGLRHATAPVFTPAPAEPPDHEPADLLSDSLLHPRDEPFGALIALALYAGAWAITQRSHLTAGLLLAIAAAIFTWQRTFVPGHPTRPGHPNRRAVLRLAAVLLPAIFVTAWALLDGVAHRNRLLALQAALAASNPTAAPTRDNPPKHAGNGYESVIVWPYPEKKQIVPPILAPASLLAPGTTQPLVFRFDGPYWFLQPPDQLPGPRGHQAIGSPLGVNIRSSNSLGLVMQGNQYLGNPIRVARCREIDVDLEDQDQHRGEVSAALYLRNSPDPRAPAIYLGEQPIPSTEPGYPTDPNARVLETLRFAVPAHTPISSFNEIEVMFLPDQPHALLGPKIAIRQFQLFPR